MLDNNNLTKYLGLAQRSGSLVFGLDNIFKAKQKIHLILVDKSFSENSIKKAQNFCLTKNIDLIFVEQLDNILHTTNCKIAGICNINIVNQIKLNNK